jgi:hypothetical protein
MKTISIILLLLLFGCAESAHVRLQRVDNTSASLRFNHGAFIEFVNHEKIIEEYCSPLVYEIIGVENIQLPEQNRLQITIRFKCETN